MDMNPYEAGAPRTKGATRSYKTDEIRVLWDATRCIHTANCLNLLPAVFDIDAQPWVQLSGAQASEIAETVRACPTGALRYEGSDTLPQEEADDPTTVEVRPNGPLYLRGRLHVRGPGGKAIAEEYRIALCRCGASNNKPYCDASHRLIGFRDSALS
jgi:uncharacterized Fe-S cluster protein YjdI/CDGSH-type Zn-finger protein